MPALALAVCVVAAGCSARPLDMDDLACQGEHCAEGYVCHPQMQVCVRKVETACASGNGCAVTASTRAACPHAGAYLPCVAGDTPCRYGCRTCLPDLTWSRCSSGSCLADRDHDGVADCIDNCPAAVDPMQVDTDRDGLGDACDGEPQQAGYALRSARLIAGGALGSTAEQRATTAAVGARASLGAMQSEHYRLHSSAAGLLPWPPAEDLEGMP